MVEQSVTSDRSRCPLLNRFVMKRTAHSTSCLISLVIAGIGATTVAGQEFRRRRFAVPENVSLETDIAYRDGNDKWKLDLAKPNDASATLRPGLVIIHGGGWRGGDKGGGVWRALPLQYASNGYVCVSINYRLTDEGTVLDCIADCKCAVRWLRANAAKYHVDPDRIGAFGNSAGAHLVAILGLSPDEVSLEGDALHQALTSAGVEDVSYMRIDGAGHGVFNQHAQQAGPAMEKFFARVLGHDPADSP